MALGNRALNERKLTDVYAGLPRNLNTELAAKTVAKLAAVFCLKQLPNRAQTPNLRTPEYGI
jgi:hypothetical protein